MSSEVGMPKPANDRLAGGGGGGSVEIELEGVVGGGGDGGGVDEEKAPISRQSAESALVPSLSRNYVIVRFLSPTVPSAFTVACGVMIAERPS